MAVPRKSARCGRRQLVVVNVKTQNLVKRMGEDLGGFGNNEDMKIWLASSVRPRREVLLGQVFQQLKELNLPLSTLQRCMNQLTQRTSVFIQKIECSNVQVSCVRRRKRRRIRVLSDSESEEDGCRQVLTISSREWQEWEKTKSCDTNDNVRAASIKVIDLSDDPDPVLIDLGDSDSVDELTCLKRENIKRKRRFIELFGSDSDDETDRSKILNKFVFSRGRRVLDKMCRLYSEDSGKDKYSYGSSVVTDLKDYESKNSLLKSSTAIPLKPLAYNPSFQNSIKGTVKVDFISGSNENDDTKTKHLKIESVIEETFSRNAMLPKSNTRNCEIATLVSQKSNVNIHIEITRPSAGELLQDVIIVSSPDKEVVHDKENSPLIKVESPKEAKGVINVDSYQENKLLNEHNGSHSEHGNLQAICVPVIQKESLSNPESFLGDSVASVSTDVSSASAAVLEDVSSSDHPESSLLIKDIVDSAGKQSVTSSEHEGDSSETASGIPPSSLEDNTSTSSQTFNIRVKDKKSLGIPENWDAPRTSSCPGVEGSVHMRNESYLPDVNQVIVDNITKIIEFVNQSFQKLEEKEKSKCDAKSHPDADVQEFLINTIDYEIKSLKRSLVPKILKPRNVLMKYIGDRRKIFMILCEQTKMLYPQLVNKHRVKLAVFYRSLIEFRDPNTEGAGLQLSNSSTASDLSTIIPVTGRKQWHEISEPLNNANLCLDQNAQETHSQVVLPEVQIVDTNELNQLIHLREIQQESLMQSSQQVHQTQDKQLSSEKNTNSSEHLQKSVSERSNESDCTTAIQRLQPQVINSLVNQLQNNPQLSSSPDVRTITTFTPSHNAQHGSEQLQMQQEQHLEKQILGGNASLNKQSQEPVGGQIRVIQPVQQQQHVSPTSSDSVTQMKRRCNELLQVQHTVSTNSQQSPLAQQNHQDLYMNQQLINQFPNEQLPQISQHHLNMIVPRTCTETQQNLQSKSRNIHNACVAQLRQQRKQQLQQQNSNNSQYPCRTPSTQVMSHPVQQSSHQSQSQLPTHQHTYHYIPFQRIYQGQTVPGLQSSKQPLSSTQQQSPSIIQQQSSGQPPPIIPQQSTLQPTSIIQQQSILEPRSIQGQSSHPRPSIIQRHSSRPLLSNAQQQFSCQTQSGRQSTYLSQTDSQQQSFRQPLSNTQQQSSYQPLSNDQQHSSHQPLSNAQQQSSHQPMQNVQLQISRQPPPYPQHYSSNQSTNPLQPPSHRSSTNIPQKTSHQLETNNYPQLLYQSLHNLYVLSSPQQQHNPAKQSSHQPNLEQYSSYQPPTKPQQQNHSHQVLSSFLQQSSHQLPSNLLMQSFSSQSPLNSQQRSSHQPTLNSQQRSSHQPTPNSQQHSSHQPTSNSQQRSSHQSTPNSQQRSSHQSTPNLQQRSSHQSTPNPHQRSSHQPTPNPQQRSPHQPTPNPQQHSPHQPKPNPQQRSPHQSTPNPQQRSSHQPTPNPQQRSPHHATPNPQQHSPHQPTPNPQQWSSHQQTPNPQQGSSHQPTPNPQKHSSYQPTPNPQQDSSHQQLPRPQQHHPSLNPQQHSSHQQLPSPQQHHPSPNPQQLSSHQPPSKLQQQSLHHQPSNSQQQPSLQLTPNPQKHSSYQPTPNPQQHSSHQQLPRPQQHHPSPNPQQHSSRQQLPRPQQHHPSPNPQQHSSHQQLPVPQQHHPSPNPQQHSSYQQLPSPQQHPSPNPQQLSSHQHPSTLQQQSSHHLLSNSQQQHSLQPPPKPQQHSSHQPPTKPPQHSSSNLQQRSSHQPLSDTQQQSSHQPLQSPPCVLSSNPPASSIQQLADHRHPSSYQPPPYLQQQSSCQPLQQSSHQSSADHQEQSCYQPPANSLVHSSRQLPPYPLQQSSKPQPNVQLQSLCQPPQNIQLKISHQPSQQKLQQQSSGAPCSQPLLSHQSCPGSQLQSSNGPQSYIELQDSIEKPQQQQQQQHKNSLPAHRRKAQLQVRSDLIEKNHIHDQQNIQGISQIQQAGVNPTSQNYSKLVQSESSVQHLTIDDLLIDDIDDVVNRSAGSNYERVSKSNVSESNAIETRPALNCNSLQTLVKDIARSNASDSITSRNLSFPSPISTFTATVSCSEKGLEFQVPLSKQTLPGKENLNTTQEETVSSKGLLSQTATPKNLPTQDLTLKSLLAQTASPINLPAPKNDVLSVAHEKSLKDLLLEPVTPTEASKLRKVLNVGLEETLPLNNPEIQSCASENEKDILSTKEIDQLTGPDDVWEIMELEKDEVEQRWEFEKELQLQQKESIDIQPVDLEQLKASALDGLVHTMDENAISCVRKELEKSEYNYENVENSSTKSERRLLPIDCIKVEETIGGGELTDKSQEEQRTLKRHVEPKETVRSSGMLARKSEEATDVFPVDKGNIIGLEDVVELPQVRTRSCSASVDSGYQTPSPIRPDVTQLNKKDVAQLPGNSDTRREYVCAVCRKEAQVACSECRATCYCSETCQTNHWYNGHAQECMSVVP